MIILGIFLIALLLSANMAYYEYRSVKKETDKDLIKAYVELQHLRKYK